MESGFGDLLRRYRVAAGLTQEELAERAGVSTRGISDLERGARGLPRKDTLQLLLQALDLSPADGTALVAAARRTVTTAAQSEPAVRPSGLPVPLTPFIGRQAEITAISTLLHDPVVRLVTLTGPGGTGKTRLAVAVAERLASDFPDGVVFVSLAALADPLFVASAIAQGLGVREVSGQALVDRVKAHVAGKRLLLVVDNFEHLVSAAPLVAELLGASSSLSMLTTSRMPLRLSGEHTYPVPPLGLPDSARLPALDELAQTEAVRLFMERAQAVNPDFRLTEANAPALAEIVRRLDGLPLALELAAARVRVLSPAALLARLDRRLPLLTGGAQDLPDRQRTLRDTIAWSHDLLPPHEQVLFRRLGVFAGGWTLEAAEAVANPGKHLDVLEPMTSLVEKNLVRHADQSDDEPRFTMLETIREFGLEELAGSGEEGTTREAHAAYFLALAAGLTQSTKIGHGPGSVYRNLGTLQQVAAELDNLRLALAWFDEHDDFDALLRLSVALSALWQNPGQAGASGVERVLERSRHVVSPARVEALEAAGVLAVAQGDYTRAAEYFAEELLLAQTLGDAYLIGEALVGAGLLAYRQGDHERMEALLDEALGLLRGPAKANPVAPLNIGRALLILADAALVEGRADCAVERYEEALELFQTMGADWLLTDVLAGLAAANFCRGDAARAAVFYGQSLARGQQALAAGSAARTQDRSFVLLIVSALLGVAGLAAKARQPHIGGELLGSADAIAAAAGLAIFPRDRPVRERSLKALGAGLGVDELGGAMEVGRALTVEQALAEALALLQAITPHLRQAASLTTNRPLGHDLTPRELDVLRLVAQGQSNREIADALFISVPTVKRHLTNVLGKLGLPSRSALNTYAHTQGLV